MSVYLTILHHSPSLHELYVSSTDPDEFEAFEDWDKDALKIFSSEDEVKVSIHRNIVDNILRNGGVTNILWRD